MATAETALLVAGYSDLSTARRGFQAIWDLYYETRALDRMDAVLLTRQQRGAVSVGHQADTIAEPEDPIGPGSGLAGRLAISLAPRSSLDRVCPYAREEPPRTPTTTSDFTVGLDRQTRAELADLIVTSPAALLVVIEPSMLRPVQGIVAGADRLSGAEIQVSIDAVTSAQDTARDAADAATSGLEQENLS